MIINKIQPYNIQNNYKPSFQAVIPKGATVKVKYRGEYIPENVTSKFFSNIKEIFFEAFPKLDPEYEGFILNGPDPKCKMNKTNWELIGKILTAKM